MKLPPFEAGIAIAGKGSRKDVDKVESGFKRLVDKMAEVVFEHLSSLNAEHAVVQKIRQTVKMLHVGVSELVACALDLQPHISAYSPSVGVVVHVLEHLKNRVLKWLKPDIQQQAYFWLHKLAEAQEKQSVTAEFSCVSMLDAQQDVELIGLFKVVFVGFFLYEAGNILYGVDEGGFLPAPEVFLRQFQKVAVRLLHVLLMIGVVFEFLFRSNLL